MPSCWRSFLRTGVAGRSAVDLARHLLAQFGGLRPLLEASQTLFSQHLGLGPAKFAQLQAVLEMSRRHLAERLRADSVLESPLAVREYLKALLRHEPHEIFGCLFLDSKHRVLGFEVMFPGHHRRCDCLSATSGQARLGVQRGGVDPVSQPPVGERGAQRG